jgi:hypothetical protein
MDSSLHEPFLISFKMAWNLGRRRSTVRSTPEGMASEIPLYLSSFWRKPFVSCTTTSMQDGHDSALKAKAWLKSIGVLLTNQIPNQKNNLVDQQ